MRDSRWGLPAWQRVGLRLAVGVLGLAAIVGSGGGLVSVGDAPECSFFSNTCNPVIGPIPPLPTAEVRSALVTAQVGTDAVFEVRTFNLSQPSYQWCRVPPAGGACVTIAGATEATYRAVAVNLADDGALYMAVATGTEGVASASGRLAVSPMPGVVYQDGEFAHADWAVSALVEPAQNGPTFTVALEAAGGNPGAYRSAVYDLTSTPSSVLVLHRSLTATYDASAQGAIRSIDFTEDCIRTSVEYVPYTVPLIEQGGRSYTAHAPHRRVCPAGTWQAVGARSSLVADDFVLVDGPACGSGESCPDFGANAAPIELGLASAARLSSGLPGGTTAHFAHGFDNWRVTVWRR